jgi:serine phosphatase RsbU (regulator of sigma subunit)
MPPLLRSNDGQVTQPGRNQFGPPLGAVRNFEFGQHSFSLGPEDTLILYTDGITEARCAAGEEYGEARLREQLVCHSRPREISRRIMEDVARFTQNAPQMDDICLLCFGRAPLDPA